MYTEISHFLLLHAIIIANLWTLRALSTKSLIKYLLKFNYFLGTRFACIASESINENQMYSRYTPPSKVGPYMAPAFGPTESALIATRLLLRRTSLQSRACLRPSRVSPYFRNLSSAPLSRIIYYKQSPLSPSSISLQSNAYQEASIVSRYAPSIFFFTLTTCFFGTISNYVCSDFSIYNILTNSTADVPLFYKISATWSNHEGSLLLWCWLLSFNTFLFCISISNTQFVRLRSSVPLFFSGTIYSSVVARVCFQLYKNIEYASRYKVASHRSARKLAPPAPKSRLRRASKYASNPSIAASIAIRSLIAMPPESSARAPFGRTLSLRACLRPSIVGPYIAPKSLLSVAPKSRQSSDNRPDFGGRCDFGAIRRPTRSVRIAPAFGPPSSAQRRAILVAKQGPILEGGATSEQYDGLLAYEPYKARSGRPDFGGLSQSVCLHMSHTLWSHIRCGEGPTLEGGATSEQYEGRLWRRSITSKNRDGKKNSWMTYFRSTTSLNFVREQKQRNCLLTYATKPAGLILIFFTTFCVVTSNPFLRTSIPSINSLAELNPILQDPVLAIHPPCIYAGYVSSAIAFSLCMSVFYKNKARMQANRSRC